MVGIISNPAALAAQSSLERANRDSQTSISRLSSGNRISRAADDVGGMAVGKVLETSVITLTAALTNTSQALSLLGVADGAISEILNIGQRQKALASQATAGSLSPEARGYLDLEFKSLKKEIDRISSTTNFNGIKLIDGGLFDPTRLTTDSRDTATRAETTVVLAQPATATGKTFAINNVDNGATTTFTTNNTAGLTGADAELIQLNITVNNSVILQATRLKEQIDLIANYNGTDSTVLTAKANLADYEVTNPANGTLRIQSRVSGNRGDRSKVTVTWTGTAADVTVDGVNSDSSTRTFNNAGVDATNGAMYAGTFSAGATALSGTSTTIATGSIPSAAILRPLTTTVIGTTGIDSSGISNNPDFKGVLSDFSSGFSAIYRDTNIVDLELKVGDFTYRAQSVKTNYTANTIVSLSSIESGGGTLRIQFAANNGQTVTNVTEADKYAKTIDAALSNVVFYQRREVTNFVPAGVVYPTGSATASGDLAGAKAYIVATDFRDIKVEDVKVKAPPSGASEASIEFMINGSVYRSGYDYDGAVLALGSSITNTSGTHSTVDSSDDGWLAFVNEDNPNELLILDYASATNLSITSAAEAEGAELALKKAFGIGNNAGADTSLTFQVGTTSDDIIAVGIQGVAPRDIYVDDDGIYQDLAIDTVANATAAGDTLDTAIGKIITARATIGAYQSRFSFAASNIRTSIQNQDAARASFLDTDVAAESTLFAQSQVRMSSSIATLAQANQIPQMLMKLIS